MKNFIYYILLSLCAFVLSSCHKDDEPVQMRHAVLVYMVAENSLMSSSNNDIREMLRGKSQLKDDEEIILYVDGGGNPAIYQITNKTEGSVLDDLTPAYKYSENRNSCSVAQFEDFLAFVKTNYPVDINSLVLWSHGSGWIPSSYSDDSQNFAKRRSFGVDNGKDTISNDGSQMCISDLHTALQSFGKKFNYLFFDACLMQSVEVDYELRDVANYIIASPAEIPGPGADYEAIMTSLFDETSYAKTIPETYYNSYKDENEKSTAHSTGYGVLISSVDCAKLDALMQATKNVVDRHYQELMTASYDSINNYFWYYDWRWMTAFPDYYDMNGIFKTLLPEDDYKEWKSSFDQAVPYSYATKYWNSIYFIKGRVTLLPFDHDQYGGVSMYIPFDKYSTDQYASKNAFFVNGYKQSSWAKAIGLDGSRSVDEKSLEY